LLRDDSIQPLDRDDYEEIEKIREMQKSLIGTITKKVF
jgi:hypothetical protein